MVTGIEAKTLKNTPRPDGWLTVTELKDAINRSTNTIYVGLRAGKVSAENLCYWAPHRGRHILLIHGDGAQEFLDNTRDRVVDGKQLTQKIEASKDPKTKSLLTKPDRKAAKAKPKRIRQEVNDHISDTQGEIFNLAEAKLYREKLHIAKQELELQKARNELISVARVDQLLGDMAIQIRQSLLGMIPRVCPIMAAETDVRICMSTLENEIENVLSNLISIDALLD